MGKQALLVMDFQEGIVSRFAQNAGGVIDAAVRAVEGARRAGVPVVFVRVAFRTGAPEVSAKNKSFSALTQSDSFNESSPATQIIEQMQVTSDDIVVVKRRVGAFASDLSIVLKGLDVDELTMCGISTSGCVLSTLRHAADNDFACRVLSDACADSDDEVHRVLMEKVFPRQATVLPVDEWVSGL
jgi:nicotinamidase-related amidase